MLVPFNAVWVYAIPSTSSFPINSKWNRIQMSFTSISIRIRSKHTQTQVERIKHLRRLYILSNVLQCHAQGIYLRQKTPAGLDIFNSNPPTLVKWIKQKFLHRSEIASSSSRVGDFAKKTLYNKPQEILAASGSYSCIVTDCEAVEFWQLFFIWQHKDLRIRSKIIKLP
jgi:hypothetical protein